MGGGGGGGGKICKLSLRWGVKLLLSPTREISIFLSILLLVCDCVQYFHILSIEMLRLFGRKRVSGQRNRAESEACTYLRN